MKADKAQRVHALPVEETGAKGVAMRVLMSDEDGAPNFVMRVLEIEPGGNTLYHTHAWEHEVYVLQGTGAVKQAGREYPLERDSFVLVSPGEEHQFINKGKETFKFICVVPIVQKT